MDTRNIMPDPCDNRIIRFNNCMQLLACVCHIAACIEPSLRDLADLIDFIADIVFYTTAACMTTQAWVELDFEKQQNKQVNWNYQPVMPGWNKGDGEDTQGGFSGGAPQQQTMGRPVVAMAQAQPRMFQVQAPVGMGPGQQITVQTPEGQMMGVVIPPGVTPGGVFQVNY
jgi:hypothetical protein